MTKYSRPLCKATYGVRASKSVQGPSTADVATYCGYILRIPRVVVSQVFLQQFWNRDSPMPYLTGNLGSITNQAILCCNFPEFFRP